MAEEPLGERQWLTAELLIASTRPRNSSVAVTAPQFQNGSVTELKEAMRIMARTQLGFTIGDTPALAAQVGQQGQASALVLQPASAITASGVDELATFLESLTNPRLISVSSQGGRRAR